MAQTTYKAEIRATGAQLNASGALSFTLSGAGSSALNPLQAGLGARIDVVCGAGTSDVSGVLRDGDRETPVSFSRVGTTFRWTAEGAVGGARLGFVAGSDYDVTRPFQLVVTVLSSAGRVTISRTLWVGNGDHGRVVQCTQREGFYATVRNCCYDGLPFRARAAEFNAGYGEIDYYFSPADGYAWAHGLPNPQLGMSCQPNAALQNPYLPDSVTGVAAGKPDNPFVRPNVAIARPTIPYDVLPPYARLREQVDGTAGETGILASIDQPPRNAYDLAFTAEPAGAGFNALSPASKPLASVKPTSRRTARVRGWMFVSWVGAGVNDPLEAALSISPTPRLRFTISGLDTGEQVYLWASPLRAEYEGPAAAPAGPATPPLGVQSNLRPGPVLFPRRKRGSGGPATVSRVALGLGAATQLAVGYSTAPAAITGVPTWAYSGFGGFAVAGTAGSVTFEVPVDVSYLTAIVGLFQGGASAPGPEAVASLYLQGLVLRPGTFPLPSNGPGGSGLLYPSNRTQADWPQDAFLTNVSVIRVRA